ncbi:MAG: diadenylate cyclase CdaA [Phascolarctobacterium sp.]|nr:diadenylate cyclase CdaA [Phascolarctobacterium sp.]MBQ8690343.1 diadenylate cyclase CdaA [Phascolarctobacterium sp.]MBR2038822.1 diadenylate cyclase CdaA [Phascolarctobacterium sp.]MBR2071581.1 diadenylate cyclase CdaA [Phascolarctobacterium sp.]
MLIQIQGLLATIGILDIVDIAVVAYFLYTLYQILKNTRAATLVKGLLILLIIMMGSRWMNLHVITWLMEKSMTVILVALPVVFQPELRRALEQIGRGKWFHKGGSELDEAEFETMLSNVTNATVAMSRRKLGALMVFERNTGLEERIETGTAVDGLLSEALLLNIFEKDTPLHDGAVIIRGKRIVAASCLLPLTENRNLSQDLGTRHRAGIGVSEQSDAVVLIVSEETGTISIARNGELIRYLHADDVREILRDALFNQGKNVKEAVKEKFKSFKGEKK